MIRALAKIVERRPPRARREAGALVLRLRLGAGRGGDRIPGQGVRRRSTSPTSRASRRRWPRHSASTVDDGVDVAVPIWTTTPWTLPAIAGGHARRGLDYVLVEGPARDGHRLLAGARRAAGRAVRCSATASTKPIVHGRAKGAALEGQRWRIRSTTSATSRSCSATTSRPRTAPAPCIPRPAMARKTSSVGQRTA